MAKQCGILQALASMVERTDSRDQFPSRRIFIISASSESKESASPGAKSLALIEL